MIREGPKGYYLIIPLAAVRKNTLNRHHFSCKELQGEIRKVLSGGKYITLSVADKLLSDLGQETGHPPHETTP
jgi:DNA-binding NarL/FixJ family response regulator